MDQRHQGKRAIVTGAASGIGKATAIRLAAEGAAVACLDLAGDAAVATAEEISNRGGTAFGIACDLADPASAEAGVGAAVQALGGVDILCNVAGVGSFYRTETHRIEDWDRILDVNLKGTFLMCRYTLPHLLEKGGVIVNTASTAGVMGQPYSAAYCASKGGVVMLTKALATEYKGRGVRVNAVAPGGTSTPLAFGFHLPEGADYSELAKMISPMGMSEPADQAALFAYLASDEARYVTGSVVMNDGGITA